MSPVDSARRRCSGSSTASSARAIFGPTPETDCTSTNRLLRLVGAEAEQGQRVLAHHQVGDSRACSPRRRPGQGGRRGADREPDPTDLDDDVVEVNGEHLPRTELIIGAILAFGRGREQPVLHRRAPQVAQRQRERVRGVRRSAGVRQLAAVG